MLLCKQCYKLWYVDGANLISKGARQCGITYTRSLSTELNGRSDNERLKGSVVDSFHIHPSFVCGWHHSYLTKQCYQNVSGFYGCFLWFCSIYGWPCITQWAQCVVHSNVCGLTKIRVAHFNNTKLQVCQRAKSSYRVAIDISNGRNWHHEEAKKITIIRLIVLEL